ncbi:glycosyltransferase family 2 protein [Pseudodesulfovibrio sp. zrk46]|uniref:glycosyltransferase family 2 protein n=1 Tax=Pseudodesulfovibrio sp. zrk46 TaxID=2725288 RepID=UPI001448F115|nr:glycosyltransferase family 2 protein [Pseudodesulfovibrio sp. zrk46]QJB57152.1 glycosyltransferase [Pseudodesulfovibrio sp. zrk46]
MNELNFTQVLPACAGIQPEFKNRFSGWPLGMGQPDNLAAMLKGLNLLGKEHPGCRAAAVGMSLWGFQSHPLNPNMPHWAANSYGNGLTTSPKLKALILRLTAALATVELDPEHMDTWYALARQDDRSLILRFLTVMLSQPTNGIAWLAHCWQDLIHLGKPEIPKAALDMVSWDETTLEIKERMHAEWAFHCLPAEEALPVVQSLNEECWGLWRAYAGAELLQRMGKKGAAKGVLATLWKAIPWHINLTLKLYDLFHPVQLADDTDTQGVAILAYSWNKADLLADTLASLADSDIGNAKVFTLNNGSTDHTADVLRAAQDRFGADRFHIETLPINVGAPAARNWLLALPEVRASRWAAFLDDDIVLPPHWLKHLLGAAKGQENLGVVGCRITAATSPFGLQSADYNLFPAPPAQPEPGKLPNRVLVFDNCAGSTDTGLFTYTRPCLSVSGCCHMINMQAVEKAGVFDLRYTPSQFDDLDRDLRSALAGMPALYTGSLAIRHVQHSSLAKSQTSKQIGHVMGNKFKLDTKYTDDELATLASSTIVRLWADFQMKHDFLVDHLGHRA